MTMAFPTLFPDGAGDFYQARLRKVDLGEYFKHLLRFRGGRFAQHKRFPWFALNTCCRHPRHVVYWTARRHELMDLIREKGTPDVFCTLSAADLHWPDLHRHISQTVYPTEDPRPTFSSLLEIFSDTAYAFFWLKDAPKADEIDWDALKSPDTIPSHEQAVKMRNFSDYWSRIIVASSPFPRHDELLGEHPCGLERNGLNNTKEELTQLLNWTQRHTKCMPGYCLRKQNVPGHDEPQIFCRFDYPMALRQQAGVGLDSKGRVRFEPQRNDPLMNPYNPAMILGWRANIDIKPVSIFRTFGWRCKLNGGGWHCTVSLLLGIPLVRTSVTFQTLYIGQ